MRTIKIPTKNKFQFNYGTDKRPELGVMVYCFDDDGIEIGMFNRYTTGDLNTSTAGRKWSTEMKSKLV